MGFLVVCCRSCGKKYRLRGDEVFSKTANVCPSCFAEIQRSFWEKHVIPAWAAFEDTNRDLKNMHSGYENATLFAIEYKGGK